MAFKLSEKKSVNVSSPEEMFDDYKNRTIKGLISHQADILREYNLKAVNESNVAFQLPTGSGKTLVGLLVAEWRRRKFGERVVYLCPTKQLANQVVEQGTQKYGIKTTVFNGSARDYSPSSKLQYQNSETVAVTTYGALFNANPFFSDPNVIILDDSHVAENYISNFWSVTAEKGSKDCPGFYESLTGLLKPYISTIDFNRMLNDQSAKSQWVEKLPAPFLWEAHQEIVASVDEHVKESSERYAWQNIRNHICACNFYYSANAIFIRPMIPPTMTYAPFSGATQRIFMSATLGSGGDLERMTGVKNICRLAVSKKWETTAVGRRLFFFPDNSLVEQERDILIGELIEEAKRAVVLVPSFPAATEIEQKLRSFLPGDFSFFNAREIEESKKIFILSEKAVAVIANRYDGIDFEHDDCRLLILQGFPRTVNMQEQFLMTRLGAKVLFLDRRITRMTQALGRCTRAENDYSAVVVSGYEFGDILINKDRRKHLHPEIQSEIEFGIDQSRDSSRENYLENLKIFLEHGDEWNQAEKYIIQQKNDYQPLRSAAIEQLAESVPYEVDFIYSMWRADYLKAFDLARETIGILKDSELQGYRTLWNYLAGCSILFSEYAKGQSSSAQAAQYFQAATKSNLSINWFSRISEHAGIQISPDEANNEALLVIVERLENHLEALGTQHNQKFTKECESILKGLNSSDSVEFERAHVLLGELIGYESGKKESSASPDPWWIISDDLYLVFEDHSGAMGHSPFDATKARQAFSHPNWVKANLKPKEGAEIIPVIISPCVTFERSALPHLENVKFWNIAEFRTWAANLVAEIKELRKSFRGVGDLSWRNTAMNKYKELNLDPVGMRKFLQNMTYKKIMKENS